MKYLLIIALAAGAIFFYYATVAAKKHYKMTDINFGSDLNYNAVTVRCLIQSQDNLKTAAHFVAPILFPIDLMLLICIGAFLALLSMMAGDAARLPSHWMTILLVLPVFYVACDLAENTYFTHMLLSRSDAVTDEMVGVAKAISALKIGGLLLAALQAGGLCLYVWLMCGLAWLNSRG